MLGPETSPCAAPPKEPRRQAARRRPALPGKTLFRYLGRGLGLNCLLAFLILEAVQGIIFTIRATEDYSFDILIIFPVLVRAFAQAVSYTLPLSLLFGTSLLVGRLNADRELLALRSFGVSPLQTVFPVAAMGGLLSLGALVFNNEWAPEMRFANRNSETMILNSLGYLGEGWNLQYPSAEMNLWVRHYDGPVLEDMFVGIGRSGKAFLVSDEISKLVQSPSYGQYLFAQRGVVARGKGQSLGRIVLELEGVSLFIDQDFISLAGKKYADADKPKSLPEPEAKGDKDDKPADPVHMLRKTPAGASRNFMQRARFERLELTIIPPKRDKTVKDMSSSELGQETSDRAERLEKATAAGVAKDIDYAEGQYWYAVTEFHRRLSLSFSTLFFPFCAFLLGLSLSSANRLLPFFLSTTVIPCLYFSGEMFGNYLAKKGLMPWVTEELGNLALASLCALLLWKLYLGPRGRKFRRQNAAVPRTSGAV